MRIIIIIMSLLAISLLMLASWGLSSPTRSDSLPKTVWTFSSEEDTIIDSLCLERLQRILGPTQWKLKVLTPANSFTFLKDKQTFQALVKKYHHLLTTAEFIEVVKIFILKDNGGLWVDPGVVMLQSPDWLQKLTKHQGVIKFGSESYEVALFTSRKVMANTAQEYTPDSLSILLGSKSSPLLVKWAKDLEYFMDEYLVRWKETYDQEHRNILSSISLYALQNILLTADTPNQHKIWLVSYRDYHGRFKHFTQRDPEATVDLYIRYPASDIYASFGEPEYFMELGEVRATLSKAINPNISKLAMYNEVPAWDALWPPKVDCIHPFVSDSLVAELLVKDSNSQQSILKLDRPHQVQTDCDSSESEVLKNKLWLLLKVIAGGLVLMMAGKIQKVLVRMLWKEGMPWSKQLASRLMHDSALMKSHTK